MTPEKDGVLDGIAIIGMAGRFPGTRNLDEFWQNLVEGKRTITRFTADELAANNATATAGSADFVAARGVLDDAAMFDADYFGISPREADAMDPQHRVFLEVCSAALEDGGYDSHAYAGEIGLFAGCSLNTYLLANLAKDREFLDELTGNYQVGEFQVALGNDKDFLTTRAAYKLNLRGPVMSVQSACATSLVAICQASQALMNFQCDMALAGGVSITFPQERGHVYQEGGISSSDGHCRPFDAQATGTVFGHGAGVVLLKRMEDALRDGDNIAAVIRGFAVNNDGSAKAGYMAPGVDGQARVIAAAQAMAGVNAETISYVEAHGTATPLGDPIEVAALTKVFRASTQRTGFCRIGTAKGNVGHLDAAAGVTGVIKTVLSMKHRTLPGLAHFEHANPDIDLHDSPFFFDAKTAEWVTDEPRRAGVSAFGVGGVNAHLVIEEAPGWSPADAGRRGQVVCVSGRTEAAVRRVANELAEYLTAKPETSLADAAFTLNMGRKAHNFRFAVNAASNAEVARKLASASLDVPIGKAARRALAFQFSGQGTQFVGMGKELYDFEPVYREVIDACSDSAREWLKSDLREVMFAAANDSNAVEKLQQTGFAQPALFITELALARLWQSWGVEPAAMIGHSLGEYVAATLAGVFKREDALRLVCLRGKLMQALPAGAMLSVALGEAEASRYASDEISLAAVNSPRACVLAGPVSAIDGLATKLERDGVAARRLRTSHAFHSAMMEPMLAKFEAEAAKVPMQAPNMRFVSSVTGQWVTANEATSASYWTQQCRQPVRYQSALACLMDAGIDLLLEVGPGTTLTTLTQQQSTARAVASLNAARESVPATTVQDALAILWTAGTEIDWNRYYAHERRRRVSLPTYPFERKLHWIAPQPSKSHRQRPKNKIEETPTMTVPPPAVAVQEGISESRNARLRLEIAQVFAELSGIETTPEEAEYQFLELGFDSLFLTQATAALSKRFALKLTFRQLMEQYSTIAGLAGYLDQALPADAFKPLVVEPVVDSQAPSNAAPTQGIDGLLAEQLAALSKLFATQVEALRAAAGGTSTALAATPALVTSASQAAHAVADAGEVRFASFRASQPKAQQETDETQQAYLDALISKYVERTPGSKRLTAAGRTQLADPRAVAGFRSQWKEMVYPLLVEQARGSRLWDVDGNEYIDIVNGYGCIMFGHSPEFVVDAITDQLDRGVAIGPQSPLAAEVAALLCELTGNERVTFCNTGSEAVMAAIRVARTVTGRDKIVYFAGDYHGTFDEVLIRNTPRGSAPVAPGIPLANVTNVTVLEYGADASLEYLRKHGDELAAVLVEPVQTRNPGLQPADFIREVRMITERAGAAMILDEVVTGFRLAQGGAQQHFGVRADMCTYGKVIGGGHPIGVLSGKAEYLDALDGGAWQFGDDSAPEVGVTFFAGTFVRHPLALAAAKAVLLHLKEQGPDLQNSLNAKTRVLAETLDGFFAESGIPCRVHHFASWFYFTFPHDVRLGSLLYYALRLKGIHIQEGYPCFLTTAHSHADLAAIEAAFKEAISEMQESNVLPGKACTCQINEEMAMLHPKALTVTPSHVPLTESQREIYLAAALNVEGNCAFNESLTLDLRGPVRIDDVVCALDVVMARHDALHSTISEDGESLVVAGKHELHTSFVDLNGLSAAQQQQILQDARIEEGRTPFVLTSGPLARATCYQLATDHAVLLLTAHHIVLDGWSANQLLEEVGLVYSKGKTSVREFAPLLPFSSYAVLEREREKNGDFATNELYWVEKFKNRTPRLDLPLDHPHPLVKSYAGDTIDGSIDSALYAALKKASARAGCTLYVTLLSTFQLLMHRLSGQNEAVVGISTAGQALLEGASLVGHCVNFLPMLSTIEAGMTAREHLLATKRSLLDAYDHQEFTFGSLLRKLKIDREPGRTPLIEVQFNLERLGTNVRFEGLTAEIRANAKQFVNTDLFLNVVETGSELQFTCDYNTELLKRETIERWLDGWKELLRSGVATPEARVGCLRCLSDLELSRVTRQWNATEVEFGNFEPMYAVFLRRATEMPDQIALECSGVRWSNRELAAYARGLTKRLLDDGLRRGDLVGICVPRSPEMVGAVLAVMMAGGAYLPLDPRHPQERLESVLADSGATILLTTGSLALKTEAKVLNVKETSQFSAAVLLPQYVTASELAYVIYTSGSTGRPKGVAIEHGALMNLLLSMQREPGLRAEDVLVSVTTLAFDIAGLELMLPLLTGARLVVATDAEVQDGIALVKLLEQSGATTLQATPGAWRILIDAGWTGALPLKAWCGGEALPRELAEKMLDRAGEVWNVYGPTETTIWSSATRVMRGTGTLHIGPPIANTQFYVLDEWKQPLPIGVTGELYIAGCGLARGYWNRAELTAEKFSHNPFVDDLGARMYATGDLARWHDDGTIELLGRSDFQVKIRGYRIELAEIEGLIAEHPQVKETVVTQSKAENGGANRLVAYVATGFGAEDSRARILMEELPAMLAKKLPEYMVPSAFVILEKLPHNTNGKIDRKALPPPYAGAGLQEQGRRPFLPAVTPIEKLLAGIWAEVLELSAVSISDSIFELGADSLLIFRIAARAQREGLPVTASQIFQRRTIAGICEVIEDQQNKVPIRKTGRIAVASRDAYRVSREKVDA